MIIHKVGFLLVYFFHHKQKLTFPCTEHLEVWKFSKLGSNWEVPIYEYSSIITGKLGTVDFQNPPIWKTIIKARLYHVYIEQNVSATQQVYVDRVGSLQIKHSNLMVFLNAQIFVPVCISGIKIKTWIVICCWKNM